MSVKQFRDYIEESELYLPNYILARKREVRTGLEHCLSLGEESSCVQAFDRGNTWATRGMTEAFVY